MPKARVRVTLVAETTVEIEVDYEEGYDPADLTVEEGQEAIDQANSYVDPDWQVDHAEVIS